VKIAEIHEPEALWLEFQHIHYILNCIDRGQLLPITVEVEPSFYAWLATTVWRDSNNSVLQVLDSPMAKIEIKKKVLL
jgi:hypothetical protein